ncbi:MAG: hypothetical protein ACD_29C00434G0004 [uncultured bacterium]|nr:MAG: hypothetical protein ACD_29C00434G0004 [uncultured bacterium]
MKIPFWPTIFVLILFFLLVSLGFWQVRRYHYKMHLLKQYHAAISAKPEILKKILSDSNIEFRHVIVSGHYDDKKTILLADQLAEHQSGFDVLTPFVIANKEKNAVLINRGFITAVEAKNPNTISVRENQATLIGYVKFPDQYVFYLGPEFLNLNHALNHQPLQIQKIDIPSLKNIMKLKLYPFVIRLSPDQSNGFYRQWPITTIMPQRHMAYAVQWFLMAAALIIAYLFFLNTRRTH